MLQSLIHTVEVTEMFLMFQFCNTYLPHIKFLKIF